MEVQPPELSSVACLQPCDLASSMPADFSGASRGPCGGLPAPAAEHNNGHGHPSGHCQPPARRLGQAAAGECPLQCSLSAQEPAGGGVDVSAAGLGSRLLLITCISCWPVHISAGRAGTLSMLAPALASKCSHKGCRLERMARPCGVHLERAAGVTTPLCLGLLHSTVLIPCCRGDAAVPSA